MKKTEQAMVMREVPVSSNGKIVHHDDPGTAALELMHEENISLRDQVSTFVTLIIAGQQGLIEQLRLANEQIADIYRLRNELVSEREKAKDNSLERELKRNEAAAKTELLEKIGHGILALAPTLANKITGAKLTPAELGTLQPFMASIRPEQWDHICKGLDAEQIIALQGLVGAMPERATGEVRKEEEPCDDESQSTE